MEHIIENLPRKPEILEEGLRAKTSLRMHYEAQVEVIQKQIGDLESIRNQLGLSQRKMCQLLLVDPSAWTRWAKGISEVPPHIYRSLQWYLSLNEKIPGLTPQYFIGKDPEILGQVLRKEFQGRIHELEAQNEKLKIQIQGTRAGFYLLGVAVLIMAGAFALILSRN